MNNLRICNIVIIMFITLIINTGCFAGDRDVVPNNSIQHDQQVVTRNEDFPIDERKPRTEPFNHDIQTFTFQHEFLKSDFTAPEYMNKEFVVFTLDSSETSTGYIYSITRESQNIELLYQVTDRFVHSLAGIDDRLYWVEYPREILVDTPWEIKTMHLATREVETFRKGIAKDEMFPPVLAAFRHQLTWIEKRLEDAVVTSTAMVYEPASDTLSEAACSFISPGSPQRKPGISKPMNWRSTRTIHP